MAERQLDFADFEGLAAQVLEAGSRLRFQAHGSSMHPFIQDGDTVEVMAVPPCDLRPGQVVLCRLNNGRLVVHRVLKVKPDGLLVQGDALLYPDGLVSFSAVLGRVISLERGSNLISLDTFKNRLLIWLWIWLTPIRGSMFQGMRFGRAVLRAARLLRK